MRTRPRLLQRAEPPGRQRAARMTGAAGFLAAIAIALSAASIAEAQCPLKVRPRPGETGYQRRVYGCEGMYIQLQSAPINLQVISLVRHAFRLPEGNVAHVHVPANPAGLRPSIAVAGRGREANLNWALDAEVLPGRPMQWHLDSVVREVQLDVQRLGMFGETRRTSGLGGPVYVPVDVRSVREPYPGHAGAVPPPVELVLRIASAGELEYRLPDADWVPVAPFNGDGYFLLPLQSKAEGLLDLEVRWRPSDSLRFGPIESLTIYFW